MLIPAMQTLGVWFVCVGIIIFKRCRSALCLESLDHAVIQSTASANNSKATCWSQCQVDTYKHAVFRRPEQWQWRWRAKSQLSTPVH